MKKINKTILLVFLILLVCLTFVACNHDSDKQAQILPIYEVNLTYDGINTIKAVEHICYFNNSSSNMTSITISLDANAYTEGKSPFTMQSTGVAYYDGLSYGGLTLEKVLVENTEVDYTFSDDMLFISFQIPSLSPQKSINLNLYWTALIPKCIGRFGITEESINLNNFIPQVCVFNDNFNTYPYSAYGDPYFSEMKDMHVNVTVPKEYDIGSSGKITAISELDDTKTFEILSQKTRDFGLVLSTNFKTLNTKANGINIIYKYLKDSNSEESINLIKDALSVYSSAFGVYPYDVFTAVETPFIASGMEYSTMMLLNVDLNKEDKEYTILHEVAHQWWYGVIGSNPIDEPYLDEGLTEFSTAYYFKLKGNKEKYNNLINQHNANYLLYYDYAKANKISFDGKMTKSLSDYTSQAEYTVTAYDKGALMISSIYDVMGQKKFKKAISKYYKDNRYSICSTSTLKKYLEKYSRGIGKTIDSWLNGTVVLK